MEFTNRLSQAKPAVGEDEPTRVRFALVPEDREDFTADAHPRVAEAIRRACAHTSLSDAALNFDPDEGRVVVEAMNPTSLAPSRVLHDVWAQSIDKYHVDPKASGSLQWARGFLLDDGEDGPGDVPPNYAPVPGEDTEE
jgi:hypothetical protein